MSTEQSILPLADGSVIILSQGLLLFTCIKWLCCLLIKNLLFFYAGNTLVMTSVFGPLEAKIQKELSDRAYIETNCKPKVEMPGEFSLSLSSLPVRIPAQFDHHPGVAERSKEKLIKTTCNHIVLKHLHPRTAINVLPGE